MTESQESVSRDPAYLLGKTRLHPGMDNREVSGIENREGPA